MYFLTRRIINVIFSALLTVSLHNQINNWTSQLLASTEPTLRV